MSFTRKVRILDSLDAQEKEAALLQKIVNLDEVNKFSFNGVQKMAKVIRVMDGDTFEVAMVHDGKISSFIIRLQGIDAPEMKPLKRNPHRIEIKREAENAKNALQLLLPRGSICTLACFFFCKFGRILATAINEQNINVGKSLVEQGFCVGNYDGGKRMEWNKMWTILQEKRNSFNHQKEVKKEARKEEGTGKAKRCCFCLF